MYPAVPVNCQHPPQSQQRKQLSDAQLCAKNNSQIPDRNSEAATQYLSMRVFVVGGNQQDMAET